MDVVNRLLHDGTPAVKCAALCRLRTALAEIMQPEHIAEWLETPNDAFDKLKPIEVVERGEIDQIWRMVFLLRSGVPS